MSQPSRDRLQLADWGAALRRRLLLRHDDPQRPLQRADARKQSAEIRVVRDDGRPISLGTAFVREVLLKLVDAGRACRAATRLTHRRPPAKNT
jgi:hypothetical protein